MNDKYTNVNFEELFGSNYSPERFGALISNNVGRRQRNKS